MHYRAYAKKSQYPTFSAKRGLRKRAEATPRSHFPFRSMKNDLSDQITPSGIRIASNRIFNPTSENRKIFFALGFIFGT